MHKKQIKTLQISSYPPPRAGWGMRVYYIKQEMEKNGDICEVLNIRKGRIPKHNEFIPVRGLLDFIIKVIKFRLKRYTIHHHLNGDSPKGFILTLLSSLISVCTFKRPIITFHAGPVQLYFPKSQAAYLTPLYLFIFHVAKYIICNNDAVKQNIKSYGVKDKKIFPIPSFSKQYLNYKRVELNDNLAAVLNDYYPIIICYAAYRPEFFLTDMINAYNKFRNGYPDSRLIMLGDDKDSEDIKSQIENLGISKYILFAGDLDHDHFLTVLSQGTLYLRTPVKDGVASSVLEALSLNLPVVASENGSRPEGVITYENGNIEDMVLKISQTVQNIERIKKNIKTPFIEDTVKKEIELIAKV